MSGPHYVYELTRSSPGTGPTRYIGVRTAAGGDPESDDYWSSSPKIAKERKSGAVFIKTILQTFPSRQEAEEFEAELHWQHMVGKNPNFYNVTAQLLEGRVSQFLPRERYKSPDGEHLWFKPGSQPAGWTHDPAKWAQFEDPSQNDELKQGARYPQTFEGLQLPEWRFIKYYPDEHAFSTRSPRHCHQPYVKLDYRNSIIDSAYFPDGCQPEGWILGFVEPQMIIGNAPEDWKLFRHRLPSIFGSYEGLYQYHSYHQAAFFPELGAPKGWSIVDVFEDLTESLGKDALSPAAISAELNHLAEISNGNQDLTIRLRGFRRKNAEYILKKDWCTLFNKACLPEDLRILCSRIIGKNQDELEINHIFDCSDQDYFLAHRIRIFIRERCENLSHHKIGRISDGLDLSEEGKKSFMDLAISEFETLTYVNGKSRAEVEEISDIIHNNPAFYHVEAMIGEAIRLHADALRCLHEVKGDALPKLREARRLLSDCEILAIDAASYIDSSRVESITSQIQIQKNTIQKIIDQCELSQRNKGSEEYSFVFGIIFLLMVIILFLFSKS